MPTDRKVLLELRNALQGPGLRTALLSRVRREADPGAFPTVANLIRTHHRRAWAAVPVPFPSKLNEYLRTALPDPVGSQREFAWAAAQLGPHSTRLREHVAAAGAFDRAFLRDDLRDAARVLDEVESSLGWSLWLVKRRIVLLQVADGLEAQKLYTDVLRTTARSGVVKAVAYYTSVLCEPSVNAARFRNRFAPDLLEQGVPANWVTYLAYHISPDSLLTRDQCLSVLRIESVGSAIDYYEALVATATATVAISDDDHVAALRTGLFALASGIGDTRLTAPFVAIADSPACDPPETGCLASWEALLRGQSSDAEAEAREVLRRDPADADAMLIAARAAALAGPPPSQADGPLIDRLVNRAAQVLCRDGEATAEIHELAKYAMLFRGRPWADALIGLLEHELSPVHDTREGSYTHLAALGAPCLHPVRTEWFPPGEPRISCARIAARLLPSRLSSLHSLTVAGLSRPGEELNEPTREERLLAAARHAERRQDWGSLLDAADQLMRAPHRYFQRRGVRMGYYALMRLNRVADAAERVASACVITRAWHSLLPLGEIATAVATQRDVLPPESLSAPILFELHSRHVDGRYDSECVFALEDCLTAHKVAKPSALGALRNRFDRRTLVHFLRHVCVESTLDRTMLFATSRALLEERLAICRVLVELDPEEVDAYQEEVKSLLRRLMVQRRLPEIEQSKIYVDTDSIKRTVSEDLRETFQRYVALRQERGDEDVDELVAAARRRDIKEIANLSLPANEMSTLFERLMLRLRDEYVSSPEHGLDKYLSVRIRHGTLTGQLRRPVEEAHLVTLRATGSPGYEPNEYWNGRLGHVPDPIRKMVLDRLGRFSMEFDAFSEEIRSWIQVRKEADSPGLFDFSFSRRLVRLLSIDFGPQLTFEEFVDSALGWLDSILDLRLERVRQRLTGEAKTRATRLLDDLARDLERFGGADEDLGELVNVVRNARTELQVRLDRISTWFRRSDPTERDPFAIEDAIELAAQAVSPSFHPEVSSLAIPVVLPGDRLSAHVDIFFIVFENISKHARSVPLAARVLLTHRDDAVRVRVENDLGPGVASAGARDRVARIRRAIADNQHADSVRREGGTGLHKLGKLLSHDVGSVPHLEFGFADNGTFFVEFSLTTKVIGGDGAHTAGRG